MKTKMEAPVEDPKSAPFTERELTQQDKLIEIDKSIGYSMAILDMMDFLKTSGVLDKMNYEQHMGLFKLKYKDSKL